MYKIIRILPMDKDDEFQPMNINEVQLEFFIKELSKRKDENGVGKYIATKRKGLYQKNNQL